MALLTDGHGTTINVAGATLYPKTITPGGVQAGGAVDVTTLANTSYRTSVPKQLQSVSETSFTAAYEGGSHAAMLAAVGTNQVITITFPDASTFVFYGWIDSFVPNEMVEGEQPTAEVTIIASNYNGGSETAPV